MLLLPISPCQQRQPGECLVACAKMVLDYLRVPVSYEDLTKCLRIGYAGAPFRNLNYLKSLGVSVLIEQGQIETLFSCFAQNLPAIVFVATQELSYWNETTNHAVVVIGIDEYSIYLCDPNFADVPKVISLAEFYLAWLEMDNFYALIY